MFCTGEIYFYLTLFCNMYAVFNFSVQIKSFSAPGDTTIHLSKRRRKMKQKEQNRIRLLPEVFNRIIY